MWAHGRTRITSARRNIPSTVGVHCIGPLKGPGSSRVLDALSCYLSLIFRHSDTKWDWKNIYSRSKFRGASMIAPPPPPVASSSGPATGLLNQFRIDNGQKSKNNYVYTYMYDFEKWDNIIKPSHIPFTFNKLTTFANCEL